MIITGLIFNLIGSLFLAYHIIGAAQVKKLEQKMMNLPYILTYDPIYWLLYLILKPVTKKVLEISNLEEKKYERKEFRNQAIEKLLDKAFDYYLSFKKDPINFSKVMLEHPEVEIFFFGYVFWVTYSILLFPLIISVSGTIKLFSKIQNTFKIESLLGVIGIILLLIGFVLQLIGNL